jgi:enoyl-CoA hydratase/carnithine racemase
MKAVTAAAGVEPVLFSTQGAIAVITINRPDVRKDVTNLTGAGKSFCAGMNLKAYLRGELLCRKTAPSLARLLG